MYEEDCTGIRPAQAHSGRRHQRHRQAQTRRYATSLPSPITRWCFCRHTLAEKDKSKRHSSLDMFDVDPGGRDERRHAPALEEIEKLAAPGRLSQILSSPTANLRRGRVAASSPDAPPKIENPPHPQCVASTNSHQTQAQRRQYYIDVNQAEEASASCRGSSETLARHSAHLHVEMHPQAQ